MRKALLATLLLAVPLGMSAPAFATDSGDAAFDLLAQYSSEKRQPNYIKLQSSIAMSDAKHIDAKFLELYGEPAVQRSGLKVWEVKNETGSGAPHTTIMCGPDGDGGLFISADRRGPTSKAASNTPKRKAARPSKPAIKLPPKQRVRSQERD